MQEEKKSYKGKPSNIKHYAVVLQMMSYHDRRKFFMTRKTLLEDEKLFCDSVHRDMFTILDGKLVSAPAAPSMS